MRRIDSAAQTIRLLPFVYAEASAVELPYLSEVIDKIFPALTVAGGGRSYAAGSIGGGTSVGKVWCSVDISWQGPALSSPL